MSLKHLERNTQNRKEKLMTAPSLTSFPSPPFALGEMSDEGDVGLTTGGGSFPDMQHRRRKGTSTEKEWRW